jgi:hypothetical protein
MQHLHPTHVRFFRLVTPEQFLNRCKVICHVGPAGVWEKIVRHGFRTAEQLITEADLNEEERRTPLSTPRRESVRLRVRGEAVILRDQVSLFARKDLRAVLDNGSDVSDWIHLLNQRVYFFHGRDVDEEALGQIHPVRRRSGRDLALTTEGRRGSRIASRADQPEHRGRRPTKRSAEVGGHLRTALALY